jgi:hypothetical protein
MVIFLVCTYNAQDYSEKTPFPQAASDTFVLAACLVFPEGKRVAQDGNGVFRKKGVDCRAAARLALTEIVAASRFRARARGLRGFPARKSTAISTGT